MLLSKNPKSSRPLHRPGFVQQGVQYSSFARKGTLTFNGLRAGARSPVLRLRQGYGACTLLRAGFFFFIEFVLI